MTEGKITALEVQKKNPERVNVYIDGEFAFGLNMLDAASLRKGQLLSQTDITRLQYGDAVVKAVDTSAHFLQFRPRSRAEVRQNLTKKKYPPDVVDAAITRLESLGYLNDRDFARFWVENRNTFKPRSPRALQAELRQKGVPDDIIREVVDTVDAHDAAYRAAHKKYTRYRGQPPDVFRKKLGGFLQRQGFGYDIVRDVLQELEDELHETDPDFFPSSEED